LIFPWKLAGTIRDRVGQVPPAGPTERVQLFALCGLRFETDYAEQPKLAQARHRVSLTLLFAGFFYMVRPERLLGAARLVPRELPASWFVVVTTV
jgi:hypothetical protein